MFAFINTTEITQSVLLGVQAPGRPPTPGFIQSAQVGPFRAGAERVFSGSDRWTGKRFPPFHSSGAHRARTKSHAADTRVLGPPRP